MRSPGFLAPAYVSRSKASNSEAINIYLELNEGETGKSAGTYYMAPGLTLLCNVAATQQPWDFSNPNVTFDNSGYTFDGGVPTLPSFARIAGPIRGSILCAGVLYVVSGNGFFSVDKNFNCVYLGGVRYLPTPVSMIENGTQIAIFDGDSGWYYQPAVGSTAAVFAAIDLPFSGPLSATYQDGFGLVNEVGTDAWWQSNLLDLSTWQALNFSTADSQPDNVVGIVSLKREVWLVKEFDTEIWVNGGAPGFAFQRLEGVFIENGIVAPYSLTKCGNRLAFVGQNEEGAGIVFASNGYELQRISNHYIERRIQSFPTMTDAIGYSYEEEGHLWYILSFNAGNETWGYDFTVSAQLGKPCWHRRAAFANGQFTRHPGNNHCYAYGKHVIGDFQSSNLYAFDLDQALDNGQPRRWVRTWRALPQPTDDPTRFDSLRIDMTTGIGVPSGTNPQCELRVSDDGGYTWRFTRIASVGRIGETTRRVMFRRLGSTKRAQGLDRLFELSSSDVFNVSLAGAELE